MTQPTAYTENEIKLYVPDLPAVEARLVAAGAALTAPRILERNWRYDNAQGALRLRHQVLRLRQDTRARLTYKEESGLPVSASPDAAWSRFEAETDVGDADAMALILEKLGFHSYMTYEKYRTTYTLDDAEIVLDEMPYGTFVEIEGHDDVIARVLGMIGLEDAIRMPASYSALFERVKSTLGLTFDDLTFANFEGITVPFEAFSE